MTADRLALEALMQIKATLVLENEKGAQSAIVDTIWHGPGETLFDYIDNSIAAVTAAQSPAEGDVVVTWNHDRSRILAVTRQDDDGRILSVIAEVSVPKVQPNVQPKGTPPVELPVGLSRSDAEFWLRKRGEIIDALRAEGLTMVTTLNGVQFMRLGKIEAQTATQAPAPEAEPHGWIVWWPTMGGGHKPIYTHGAQKPSYGHELDSKLRQYPVYDAAQAPAVQAGKEQAE